MNRSEVRVLDVDGMTILRARSGDRYRVRLAIGDKRIDVYFADLLHLEPLTAVDASPDEPNPVNFELEYG